jgi:uracil-DNA glycosylase family protein
VNRTTITSLRSLHEAEISCERCPLYRNANQVVPGEGPVGAQLMMVGEQPGDQEDLAGRPFVGPAGRMLDRAIGEAGIDRSRVFVTNAVKHFKFELRGKRRLHKKSNAYEIERCRWWNELEREIVRPALVVALGATAARSLLGKNGNHFQGAWRGAGVKRYTARRLSILPISCELKTRKGGRRNTRAWSRTFGSAWLSSAPVRLFDPSAAACITSRSRQGRRCCPPRLEPCLRFGTGFAARSSSIVANNC